MSNVLNIKKFLKSESGMNVAPDAISDFKEAIEVYGKKIIEKCKVSVTERHRKTIQPDDIKEAIKVKEEVSEEED